jgi:HPt (histidine-containing phosphotransfer) domain-containing protein
MGDGGGPIESDEALPVIDRRRFDDLADLIGRDRLSTLLVAFRRQIGSALLARPRGKGERAALQSEMHNLYSTSGSLGFVALSYRCCELEKALASGAGIEVALGEAVSALEQAGPDLDLLIAEKAS